MYDDMLYAGPIEFIETPPEPEPEPLTLAGHTTTVEQGRDYFEVDLRPTIEAFAQYGHVIRIDVACRDKRTAIERFNAAVRALEGTP